jgi:preprotein translocase subunit SecD
LVFGLGILVSMFTAVVVTRTLLLALSGFVERAPALLKSGFGRDQHG